jgi:hypothetical protein
VLSIQLQCLGSDQCLIWIQLFFLGVQNGFSNILLDMPKLHNQSESTPTSYLHLFERGFLNYICPRKC